MDPELSALEERLGLLVQRLKALREENRELRQQLAARTDRERAQCGEAQRGALAHRALLKQIPETES